MKALSSDKNVLGQDLEHCCSRPLTGFTRSGYCQVPEGDHGNHSVCVELTFDFLEFSKAQGNDLMTPRPEFGFPGLKEGDRWCLCATRWQEAFEKELAPKVYLTATHEKALEHCKLEDLKRHAIDLL